MTLTASCVYSIGSFDYTIGNAPLQSLFQMPAWVETKKGHAVSRHALYDADAVDYVSSGYARL